MKKLVTALTMSALIASSSAAFSQVVIAPETPENLVQSTQSYSLQPGSSGGGLGGTLTTLAVVIGIIAILSSKGGGDVPVYNSRN